MRAEMTRLRFWSGLEKENACNDDVKYFGDWNAMLLLVFWWLFVTSSLVVHAYSPSPRRYLARNSFLMASFRSHGQASQLYASLRHRFVSLSNIYHRGLLQLATISLQTNTNTPLIQWLFVLDFFIAMWYSAKKTQSKS